MFDKILIANRGEIAVRIIRACKEMGIATVSVFSQADRDALHVLMADESYCIGGAQVVDSYLNMPAILTIAVGTRAQAIHPGYGLLSENARFAQMCREHHIAFIGPDAEIIRAAGDKDAARRTMKAAGVPVIPGTELIEDVEEAVVAAREVGYPLLIKARSGGGGRGIRLVTKEEDFPQAFMAAGQEALAFFGDGGVYLEKYLTQVRHVEMQLIADQYGNVVCLGERECSMQRRNQKFLEESPSPALTESARERMMEASVRAAKALSYQNAGTIEYLLDQEGNFYFMEINTRLQVEHPVTEMVTGIDLVQWQIRIAAGVELDFCQEDITLDGHAIECRINAENPAQGFRPSAGKIYLMHVPGGPAVRFDTYVYQDYSVPPYYDSMIGKLIVHARTREAAIRKMRCALSELVIEGIDHNSDFQMDVLSHPAFRRGDYHTGSLKELGIIDV